MRLARSAPGDKISDFFPILNAPTRFCPRGRAQKRNTSEYAEDRFVSRAQVRHDGEKRFVKTNPTSAQPPDQEQVTASSRQVRERHPRLQTICSKRTHRGRDIAQIHSCKTNPPRSG